MNPHVSACLMVGWRPRWPDFVLSTSRALLLVSRVVAQDSCKGFQEFNRPRVELPVTQTTSAKNGRPKASTVIFASKAARSGENEKVNTKATTKHCQSFKSWPRGQRNIFGFEISCFLLRSSCLGKEYYFCHIYVDLTFSCNCYNM